MMVYNLLEKDAEVFGAVRLSPKGLDYVQDPYALTFSKDHDYENLTEQDEEDKDIGSTRDGQAFDKVLLDMLKELRKKTAKQTGYPPYAIFQEFSLEEMATTYPTTEEELAQINGVGPGKVKRYGMPFIELIKKYVKENDIETVWDVVVKSTASKSKLKIFVIQQIDRKVDLEDICEVKNVSISELLDTVESICYSGTRLNLDYYIEQVIDEDRQQEIYEYFMSAESDNIQIALQDLGDDYSEEELRLMRIKFLSEIAN
jgi:ATP-dependent DNA helicase RecQ